MAPHETVEIMGWKLDSAKVQGILNGTSALVICLRIPVFCHCILSLHHILDCIFHSINFIGNCVKKTLVSIIRKMQNIKYHQADNQSTNSVWYTYTQLNIYVYCFYLEYWYLSSCIARKWFLICEKCSKELSILLILAAPVEKKKRSRLFECRPTRLQNRLWDPSFHP